VGQLPTTSTADAAEWLENLGTEVQDGNYTDAGVELYYTDIVSGTILFLNIFLGLIQIFDYIIMIPIVFLSLAVLIYGLVLSLEQRRREVSIHRVIGADGKNLQGYGFTRIVRYVFRCLAYWIHSGSYGSTNRSFCSWIHGV
jgi:hypothetical protein